MGCITEVYIPSYTQALPLQISFSCFALQEPLSKSIRGAFYEKAKSSSCDYLSSLSFWTLGASLYPLAFTT